MNTIGIINPGMENYNQITGKYKNDLTNEIINQMEPVLTGQQLLSLNKCLNETLSKYEVFIEKNLNQDEYYETTNENLSTLFYKTKELEGLSPNSIHYYKTVITDNFIKFISKSIIDITTEDIREWLQYKQETCGSSGLDNNRRVLSSFFNFLSDEGYILQNPMKRIKKIKTPKRLKHPLKDKEVEKLRDSINNYNYNDNGNERNIAIFELLLSSGIRCAELCSIKISDVNFNDNSFTVIGKGDKERECYFNDRTSLRLNEYMETRNDDCPYLFCNRRNEQIKTHGVSRIIRDGGQRCGIEAHPHKFRHTFATNMLHRGMPLEEVQKLLGHSNMETTLVYAEVAQSDVKHSHQKYSNG